MKDLKGYRNGEERKPRSSGWFILVVSHTVIFVVGLWLGVWTGGRVAQVSSPESATSRGAPLEQGRTSELMSDRGSGLPHEASGNDETGETTATSSDEPGELPEFTYHESLRKEGAPGREIPIKDKETDKTESSRGGSVAVGPVRAPPESKGGKAASRGYFVQVSSFREEERAKAFAEHLKKRGYPAEVVSKVIMNKGIWYRVRMGPYGNETEANQKAAEIKESEKVSPFVIPAGDGESR